MKIQFLFLALLNFPAFAGVEFESAEIPISDELTKAYSEGLQELVVDEETGYNVLKYFQKNAKYPYLVISHDHGEVMKQEYDLNSDGFPEIVKAKVKDERFVFEELRNFNPKEKAYHYRRRYYPLEGTRNARRVSEYRATKSEKFQSVGNRVVGIGSFASPKNQCLRMKLVSLGDSNLFEDIEEVVNRFSIDWSSSMRRIGRVKFPAEIERGCNDKLDQYLGTGEKFSDFYGETINQGLSCLKSLSQRTKSSSGVNILFKNSIAALVGQHAYVVPREQKDMDPTRHGFPRMAENNGAKQITIICSQRNSQFPGDNREGGLGYASTGRSGKEVTFHCNEGPIKVSHPFMTLNFEALNINKSKSRETNRRMLQKVVFHEFLHTAGWDHNDFWDPVEKCAKHCFGLGSVEDKEYCMGAGGAAGLSEETFRDIATQNFSQFRQEGYDSNGALERVRIQALEADLPMQFVEGFLGIGGARK